MIKALGVLVVTAQYLALSALGFAALVWLCDRLFLAGY